MTRNSDRRSELLKCAAQVFLKHGYEATSMNLVAEKANLTKPGLYYHFKSKQDLLFSILDFAMTDLERGTREATLSSKDNEERLRKLIASHASMITNQQDGAFTLLVIDLSQVLPPQDRRLIDHRKRAYFELIRGILGQLRKDGKLREGLDETVGTFSLLGMVMWISKWFHNDGRLDKQTVAAQVTEMAMSAVLRDAARSPKPTTS